MKLKIISIIVLVSMIIAIPIAYGAVDWTYPPNSLASGYRVTTENFPDPVMIGDPVIAWAGTTNEDIDEVKFRWNYPDGTGFDPIVAIGTYAGYVDLPDGTRVYQWTNTQYPDVTGDWGIQGIFYDLDDPGQGTGPVPEQPFLTEIRARSFFAVPEVTLGTIAIIIAMFGALGFLALKRKRISIHKPL